MVIATADLISSILVRLAHQVDVDNLISNGNTRRRTFVAETGRHENGFGPYTTDSFEIEPERRITSYDEP